MRYEIDDKFGETLRIEKSGSDVTVSIGEQADIYFTLEQFKDFRRAVGYVWSEFEADK